MSWKTIASYIIIIAVILFVLYITTELIIWAVGLAVLVAVIWFVYRWIRSQRPGLVIN